MENEKESMPSNLRIRSGAEVSITAEAAKPGEESALP